jgi:hypothetical protein
MTSQRFHSGGGRYQSLKRTRLRDYTNGVNAFATVVPENAPKFHGSYGKLLFDERWIEKRREILRRDNDCCVICASSESLQVHHRQYHYLVELSQYKAPWDYSNHLMITMCSRCHTTGHSKFKVPTIYL